MATLALTQSSTPPAHLSLDEYLATSYRPDREYIDGKIYERNVGKWEHARLQALLTGWFLQHEDQWGILVTTELRTRVAPTRVRIPDLVIVVAAPETPVLEHPPLLAIEILSPDDTYSELEERSRDLQQMGVETIWIIDPQTRSGRMCIGADWRAADRLEVSGTQIYVDLPELFQKLGPAPAER
jgi:Uma2 family endonuclease